jgi:NAD(P)-dependent dehydrogenase (short-subunit alcohol dehydrogenase family)
MGSISAADLSVRDNAQTTPQMAINLAEKVIAITGANRGIGLGIAECCLANGAARVYSIDIAAPGDEFNTVAKQSNQRLFSKTADVTKEESISSALKEIVQEAGGLHGMVVNAGRTNHKSALDFTEEEIHQLFNINVSPEMIRIPRDKH